AELTLKRLLDASGQAYRIKEGDGAFYGPKIDFRVFDALHREWQLGTIQLDFMMPERFDLNFIGADGKHTRPVMIHRAMLGSLERFIGILIEHTGGDFPLWLAPLQVKVLTVTDNQAAYADQVAAELRAIGIRTEVDHRNEKIGFKVREAELERVPYAVIIGQRETANQTLSLRERKVGDQGSVTLAALASLLKGRIDAKA
ncbi:MAG: threonine--tRNA ligase, partial [Planctomycetota bacterium]